MSDIFTWQAGLPLTLAALVFGYLLGSIPFGLLLTRMAGLGGKGVATYVGVLLGLVPVIVPVFAVVWIGLAWFTRISSLSALVATAITPVVVWFAGNPKVAILMAILTAISWLKHRANIARLLNGTESRIGQKG